jgi:transposase-like protein
MEAELTFHLGYEKHDQGEKTLTNRRNGKTTKDLRTDDGPMTIEVSPDREDSLSRRWRPRIRGNAVSREFKGFDDKILSMYALGLTTRQIQDHLKEIYAVDVSPDLISRVTDEVRELVSATALPPNGGAERLSRCIRCCFLTPCG